MNFERIADLLGFATGTVLVYIKKRAQIAGWNVRGLRFIEQEVDLTEGVDDTCGPGFRSPTGKAFG